MIPHRPAKPVAILLAMQFAVIFSGTIATTTMLKFWGYHTQNPPTYIRWNQYSLFVRNWGWLLLAIPIAWWLFTSWCATRRGEGPDPSRGDLLFGLFMVLGFLLFYAFTAALCGTYRIII